MGCFYEIDGSVRVRACKEVEDLVDAFAELLRGASLEAVYRPWTPGDAFLSAGEAFVEFRGGADMSWGFTGEVDDAVLKLNPHVLEPTLLHTTADSDRGTLYLGPPEQEESCASANALTEIDRLLSDLTPADRQLLRDRLS